MLRRILHHFLTSLASVSAQAETVTDTETPEGEKVGEAVLYELKLRQELSVLQAKLNRGTGAFQK